MTASAFQLALDVEADAAPAVAAEGLWRIIDDRPILRDVGFEIAPGDYVALLGANGAGKSTLLRLLAALAPPSRGVLRFFGRPLTRQDFAARRRIGMIGHAPMLYRDLSARENLVFYGRLYGVEAPGRRADELLEAFGLTARRDDLLRTFSRGMAQRVAIARALVHEPDLLLADEPFSGLDAPARRLLEETLGALHRAGRTIILANHDLEQSLRIAQRALVLRAGRLVADRLASALDADVLLAEVTGP